MTWQESYNLLMRYVKENGNAAVPFECNYNGFILGHWVAKQRYLYRTKKLSKEKMELLSKVDTFDMGSRGVAFDFMFQLAKEYREKYGDLNVPKRYVVEKDGEIYNLGKWVEHYRYMHKKRKITKGNKEMLDTLDMKWDGLATFHKVSFNESSLMFYIKEIFPDATKYQKDGVELDIYIPSKNLAIEYDGMAFHSSDRDHKKNLYCKSKGIQIIRIRENGCEELDDGISKNYYIDKYDIKGLEELIQNLFSEIDNVDIKRDSQKIYDTYNSTLSQNWKENYTICKEYYKKNGNLLITQSTIIDNKKIGVWIGTQRKRYKQNILSNERIKMLEDIGMVWEVRKKKIA